MQFAVPDKYIYQSWHDSRRKLRQRAPSPGVILSQDEIQQSLLDDRFVVTLYKESVSKVNDALAGSYVFTLVDSKGVMLTVDLNRDMPAKVTNYPVFPGVSLAEDSCGTNAVALAMKLGEPVYLQPEQHYCYFMRDWYGCAIPLFRANQIVGQLCVSSLQQPFSKEMLVIIELLAEKVQSGIQSYVPESDQVSLTDQQREILRYLSQGLPEKAVAGEMNLSIHTIKYHKKNILHQLDAQCTSEAIVKAIRLGIIQVTRVN